MRLDRSCVSIQQSRQKVYTVRNSVQTLRHDIVCNSISLNHGSGGNSASFSIPTARWDSDRDSLHDCEFIVYIGEHNTNYVNATPVFQGFLQEDSSSFSSSDENVTFSCVSISALLAKCIVGVKDKTCLKDYWKSELEYRVIGDAISANQKWNPEKILKDLFDNLPTFYKQYVRLGNTDCLARSQPNAIADYSFKADNYLNAIQTLIAGYGNISWRERYNGNGVPHVYLEFFEANNNNSRQTVKVPILCNDIYNQPGMLIENLSQTTSVHDCVNRVIGSGQRYKVVVTVGTTDANPLRRLIRDWRNPKLKIKHTSKTGVVTNIMRSAEEWVLIDQAYGKPDSELGKNKVIEAYDELGELIELDPDEDKRLIGLFCQNVFKKYTLPRCLKKYPIESELPIKLFDQAEKNDYLKSLNAYQQESPEAEEFYKNLENQVFKNNISWYERGEFNGNEFVGEAQALAERLIQQGQLRQGLGYFPDTMEQAYGYGRWAKGEGGEDFFSVFDLEATRFSGFEDGTWTPIDGVDYHLEEHYIMLTDPGVNSVAELQDSAGEYRKIYAEADIYFTFAIQYDKFLYYDTGQPKDNNLNLNLIGRDGLQFAFNSDNFEYAILSNYHPAHRLKDGTQVEFPIYDPVTGEAINFDIVIFEDTSTGNYYFYDATVSPKFEIYPYVYPNLRKICENILLEKNKKNISYSITLPYATQSYKVGDQINITNQSNFIWDDYVIENLSISINTEDGTSNTQLTVTNTKPTDKMYINDYM